jgi:ABC-2 type transport system ATP-binding protein/lipopolysaccharide transport system ATP-binding protein
MTDSAIEAVGLSKRFPVFTERRTSLKERVVRGRAPDKQYFWALRDATFSVPKGGSLGIIGHNGSGKSTALKVLTGIYRPTSGQVTVNGSVSALLEVGAGFHPELTGRENIRLNATILGFTGRQIAAMMDQIIEFADIGDHIDAPIKHYSSGMYVRLGFAVAVMVRPDILIVDEVIAVGDEEFQRKCYDHLHRLRKAGTSMVIVSHGLGQITDLCDEAIWLDHGDVVRKGPSGAVVRGYLESVNLREAERSATEPGPAEDATAVGTESGSRRGSGELRITGVEFLDESGDPAELLLSGRPGTIRLYYRAGAALSQLVVEVTVDDESDQTVTSVSNRHLTEWQVPPGPGCIDFRMDSVLLAGGVYQVRVKAQAGGQLVDAIDRGIELTVRAADVGLPGVFVQQGGWSVHPQPAEESAQPVLSASTGAVEPSP